MENERWHWYKKYGKFWPNFKSVLIRADFKCEGCGAIDNLVFHHRDGLGFSKADYKKVNNRAGNISLLCPKCHAKVHGLTKCLDGRGDLIRELREQGHTFEEIGNTLNVSRQRAHQLYNRPPQKNKFKAHTTPDVRKDYEGYSKDYKRRQEKMRDKHKAALNERHNVKKERVCELYMAGVSYTSMRDEFGGGNISPIINELVEEGRISFRRKNRKRV